MTIVARTLHVDFIFLDLIFIAFWVGFLIRKKYWTPIKWGLFGWIVYIFVDYVLWYLITQTRHYTGPIDPLLFFIWFCFSPGFVQFSYVIVMFEKRNRNELIFWTLLFYVGWTFVAVGSQLLPINDSLIEVYRDMNVENQRIVEFIMVLINIIIAIILFYKKKLRLEDILFIFMVGTLVEFALEFTLTVSGIRLEQGSWNLFTMLINTILEFNLGIVMMYLLWVPFKIKRHRSYYFQLSYRDSKYIKTDFDTVASVSRNEIVNEKQMILYSKLFKFQDFLSDLKYYSDNYNLKLTIADFEVRFKKYWK